MISDKIQATNLSATDTVVLYPTFGYPVDQGRAWRILVRGAVYELGEVKLRERMMIRMLQRVMKVPPHALDTDIFRDRIQDFNWVTERGKRIAVKVGQRDYLLQKASKRNGHFSGALRIRMEEMEQLRADGHCPSGWLRFEVVTRPEDPRRIVGRAQLLQQRGLSVISDIDDTLRHSEVGSRRSLLANTFLHEFSSVDGMVDLYRRWSEAGAVFHYVSSSPWQLYRPLLDLWRQEGIPEGTFHLRLFRLRDHMLQRLLLRRSGKSGVIKAILDSLPERRFVLVGDSGERDPEIYANMARKFRDRVDALYIRQIPSNPLDAPRLRRAFRTLPPTMWKVFEDPSELPADLAPLATVE